MNKLISSIACLFSCACLSSCGGSADQSQPQSSEPEETAESMRAKPWHKIAPKDIEGNTFRLFEEEWFALASGHEGDMNMMTIAWGTFGVLWNKPTVTVYVSTSRYTNSFMERNDYFTITHFPPAMRSALQYIGSVSGRDGDKVEGSGLTPEFTELGNPIFSEADLAIECRKIYAHQFDPNLIPLEQREWYDQRGLGMHVAYVGEIVNVWRKK